MRAAFFGSRLTHEQALVLVCLLAVTALAWLYLLDLNQDMPDMAAMPGMAMPMAQPAWTPHAVVLAALMWAVMMAGMMLPSALPMILLFAAVQRRRTQPARYQRIAVFILGYALVWSAFAIAAALLQMELVRLAVLSPELALVSPWIGGAVFLAAGLYELSPLKNRCLDQCRGPAAFIAAHWRPGLAGGLRMGVVHGAFCLGCCWALMLLLFVGGVMNLLWVAALAVLVLLQKLLPGGRGVPYATSALMIAVGVALLWRGLPLG
jgi:predicted metal-binding membrane protein